MHATQSGVGSAALMVKLRAGREAKDVQKQPHKVLLTQLSCSSITFLAVPFTLSVFPGGVAPQQDRFHVLRL